MNYIKNHKAFLGSILVLITLILVQIYLAYTLFSMETQLKNIDRNFEGAVRQVVTRMVQEADQVKQGQPQTK